MLGWLRGKGRVDNTIPPAEDAAHAEQWRAREAQVAALDAKAREALLYGDRELMDRFIDERLELRAPRPRVRSSVPVIPGRTT